MTSPTAILEVKLKDHQTKSCPYCNQRPGEEGYSDAAVKHSLEVLAAEGKILKILMDDGEIYWQEPTLFFKEHPDFKADIQGKE